MEINEDNYRLFLERKESNEGVVYYPTNSAEETKQTNKQANRIIY